jgi:uncharacterized membrane protein
MTGPALAALYDWLMFGHVLAAMIWLGGWATLSLLALQALRARDEASVARLAATMRFVGPRLFAPATVVVAGLGVWLVLNSPEWGFGQLWVQLAVGLFAAVFIVGAGFQSRAVIGAGRALAARDAAGAARQVARWAWGSLAILVLLVLATWDMIFKP